MINFLIYFALFYILVNLSGFILKKVRIPKIYAALFLGVALSTNQLVADFANSTPIHLLTNMGMFFLLFLLGFNLNINELKKQGRFIVRITFWIIFSELIVGSLALHFLFELNWILAGIISISFATSPTVALLPILKEFKLIKTKLGQTIFGVSVLDDVVEIIVSLLVIAYTQTSQTSEIIKEIIPIIAIFMGILINKISANGKISKIVNGLALAVFGPFFFFYAGTETNIGIIVKQFLLILFLTLLIKSTKLLSAYLASRKQLGTKKSLILGISLCIKFSTSIIILMILLQKNLISNELFSILIGIKVLFKLIVPVLLSFLLTKWHSEIFSPKENQINPNEASSS